MKIIDPHVHLFDLAKGQYHWLKSDNPPFWEDKPIISRNFQEQDLALSNNTLSGFVHIEAGFNNEFPAKELIWLENTVKLPFKSIATFDLLSPPKFNDNLLKQLNSLTSFVGVRHILDDDAIAILNNRTAQENFALLNNQSLIFELQVYLSDNDILEPLLSTIDNYPQIKFIINHAGFPPYFSDERKDSERSIQWQNWQTNLAQCAQRDNVWIKCSGWEMTNRKYSAQWQQQVLSSVLASFDSDKIMLASNFPLTLFSRNYNTYWQELIALVPAESVANLCGNNAMRCYQLNAI